MVEEKKPVGIVSSYIVLSIAAILPHRLRIIFTFILNFFYNRIRTTTQLIFSVLSSIMVEILTFITYFIVLGLCAIWIKLFSGKNLTQAKSNQSYFTSKAPADTTEERFSRQY